MNRTDLELLAFERHWHQQPGNKQRAIRELFGMSSARYYRLLNALLDSPEALAADPLLVRRLRRRRESAVRQASA